VKARVVRAGERITLPVQGGFWGAPAPDDGLELDTDSDRGKVYVPLSAVELALLELLELRGYRILRYGARKGRR
jgi:hypothetical protein